MLQHLGDPLPLLASLAYPYNPSAAAICCKKSKVVKGEGWDMHTRFMDKSCSSWRLVQECLPKTTVFHGMYKPYQLLCLQKLTINQLHGLTINGFWIGFDWEWYRFSFFGEREMSHSHSPQSRKSSIFSGYVDILLHQFHHQHLEGHKV